MATAMEATTAIQDKVFSAMQIGQNAMLESVKGWADTVETVYAKLPDLMTSEPIKPTKMFEMTLGFTERVMSSQQEFATKLFEAMVPATKAATNAAAAAVKPKP